MSVSSEVQRTLVKSPPELWAELSDPATLARHLGELGEIRITGTVPERTVDWEATAADVAGFEVRGKVEIEPSGWGTRVTLSASRPVAGREADPIEAVPQIGAIEVTPEVEPEPEFEPELVEPEPRPGLWARLFRRRKRKESPQPEPVVEPEPEPEPVATVESEEPVPQESVPEERTSEEPVPDTPGTPETDIAAELAELEEQTTAVLAGVLDRLGAAHHRPFSRT